MIFDGLFELVIDILVGIGYLNVKKLAKNCGFYNFFFSAILLLFYYK